MVILATSDTHGYLPEVPGCDLFIIAGDVCPLAYDRDTDRCLKWLDTDFRQWLESIPATHIVGIAGNHDFVFESEPTKVDALRLPWTHLHDSGTEIDGLRLWGLPWVPNLPGWAFNASAPKLDYKYSLVPHDYDIVISHGPPFGYGDKVRSLDGLMSVGAVAACDMIERARPQNIVTGHIHEGYGHYRMRDTDIWNVAFTDEFYDVRGGGFIVIPDTRLVQPVLDTAV